MNLLPDNVITCLDTLCAEGCESVRHSIAELEQGNTLEVTAKLSGNERLLLLHELKDIMVVYDKKEEK